MNAPTPAPEEVRQFAEEFSRTLQRMEQSRDVQEMVSLFADGAVLSNLGGEQDQRGQDGVAKFWTAYLAQFSEIKTEFNHTICAEKAVVLEWQSRGAEPGGRPISYRGVSILVLGDVGKVSEFRTYYDSAAFISKEATPAGHS